MGLRVGVGLSGETHVMAKVLFKPTNAPAQNSSLPSPEAAQEIQAILVVNMGNCALAPQLYSVGTQFLKEASLFSSSLSLQA